MHDLPTAMVAIDDLADYKLTGLESTTQKLKTEVFRGHKYEGRMLEMANRQRSGMVVALKGEENPQ